MSGGAGSGGGTSSKSQDSKEYDGALGSTYKVRPQHFAKDTRTVRSRSLRGAATDDLSAFAVSCSPGDWGSGRYVAVQYGRAPGFLVLRRASGDSQVADLFLCGGDTPVRSITLPGP